MDETYTNPFAFMEGVAMWGDRLVHVVHSTQPDESKLFWSHVRIVDKDHMHDGAYERRNGPLPANVLLRLAPIMEGEAIPDARARAIAIGAKIDLDSLPLKVVENPYG